MHIVSRYIGHQSTSHEISEISTHIVFAELFPPDNYAWIHKCVQLLSNGGYFFTNSVLFHFQVFGPRSVILARLAAKAGFIWPEFLFHSV